MEEGEEEEDEDEEEGEEEKEKYEGLSKKYRFLQRSRVSGLTSLLLLDTNKIASFRNF